MPDQVKYKKSPDWLFQLIYFQVNLLKFRLKRKLNLQYCRHIRIIHFSRTIASGVIENLIFSEPILKLGTLQRPNFHNIKTEIKHVFSKMGNLLSVNNTTYLSEKPWTHDGAQRWSTFELYPSWSGKRHDVYEGLSYAKEDRYTETKREIVVKTKSHLPIDWTSYLDCHKEATTLATRFNKYAAHLSGVKIRFADSVISQICDVSDFMKITKCLRLITRNLHEDDNVLVEEYLKGDFVHFFSEWGEVRCSNCELLEAFVHFTHHETHGQLVVCNLKGIFSNGWFSLTNPTIHSSTGQFGSKDYRNAGISKVYRNHCCNVICNGLGLPRKNNEGKD